MIIMPKKKIQHKGKPKHASEESESDVFSSRNDSQNEDEEFTTVVDFETSKRYSKRPIESNWSKYENDPSDIYRLAERDEPPRPDDLNSLFEMASSDCAHFEFSSEKLWRTENNSVPASKIFNVDLNILSRGLACVPFHERMGLDASELSEEDKQKFYEEAENNWKVYNTLKEKLVKNNDSKMKEVENDLRSLDETMREKLDLGVSLEEDEKNDIIGLGKAEKSFKEADLFDCKSVEPKNEKKKQNIFFSETDENLEDWLDSVLDD